MPNMDYTEKIKRQKKILDQLSEVNKRELSAFTLGLLAAQHNGNNRSGSVSRKKTNLLGLILQRAALIFRIAFNRNRLSSEESGEQQ